MKKSMKTLTVVLCLVLVLCCGVGATLAALSHKTAPVRNTFTFGNFDLDLHETKDGQPSMGSNYVIVPGTPITKDPVVTVSTPKGAAAVPCYVFVTVRENNWVVAEDGTRRLDYTMADGWGLYTTLTDGTKVYVRGTKESPDAVTPNGTPFQVLAGNQVTVSPDLTKAEVETHKGTPELIFEAYAVQRAGFDSVDAAWNHAQTLK